MQNVKRKSTVPPLYLIRNERLTPPPHLLAGERVLLFDGECVMCRRVVQTLLRADWKKDPPCHGAIKARQGPVTLVGIVR
ncbi:hypothetical protein ABK905_02715 [Acerihabitans sp. KWT182]|uniref:DUF393 domain-containing protein n=1 Tax=Acerihabitans sp. KWT182 TaxID=3157919 RepID=A0AAU7QBJ6_9GAMM